MCNAHNHPPCCECGWGGVWYGGSGDSADWLFSRVARPRQLGIQSGTRSSLSGGYTVPNSHCPVCNCQVYFYKSPYGGRVFFDSLGPPWPKHPCTSSSSIRSATTSTASSWHQENWRSLSNVAIDRSGSGEREYHISGISGGRDIRLQFLSEEIVMAEIVRFKKRSAGEFILSILDFDTVRSEWAVWEGSAIAGAVGLAHELPHLTRSVIHKHEPQTAPMIPPRANAPAVKQPDLNDFVICSDCTTKVKQRNLKKHVRVQHGYAAWDGVAKMA